MSRETGRQQPAPSRATARYAARDTAATETARAVRPRRGLLRWRRSNRRITVESRSPFLWLGEALAAIGRRLFVVVKVAAALAALVASLYAVRLGVAHVVASPRFAVRDVRVTSGAGAATHVGRDELVELSGVTVGDRLLALDTDAVATRLARHPWIAAARVRRELPSTLVIDVTERHAVAVAVLGGLYLLDERGHPFKRALLEETDGLVVVTGISRVEYAAMHDVSEAAFREALALVAAYQHPDSLAEARRRAGAPVRPALSEVHIDPPNGFSLFLLDGGGEIRLGRGAIPDKLARFDEIVADLGPRGVPALRVVHLDGPAGDRVPIRLAQPAPPAGEPAPIRAVASSKKSTTSRNPGISGGGPDSQSAGRTRRVD